MARLKGLSFDDQFRDQYPRLVSELDYILGNTELARDIAQDAFTRQYVSWTRISHYDQPGAWVRRVAIRMAMRARRTLFRSAPLDEATAFAAHIPDTDRVMDVRNAILQLTKSQRAAVVLHYYSDYSVADVAKLMGCKESTAKAHLHQARQRLALLLVHYAPKNSGSP